MKLLIKSVFVQNASIKNSFSFLLAAALLVANVSPAAASNLETISENHSFKTADGKGEWEKLFNSLEYSESLAFYKLQLELIENLPEAEKKLALAKNLQNQYQMLLDGEQACKPFSWNIPFYMIYTANFNNISLEQIADLDAFYKFAEEAFKTKAQDLDTIGERLDVGVQQMLLPQGSAKMLLDTLAYQPDPFGVDSFIANLPMQTCSFCTSIDPKILQDLYFKYITPALEKFTAKYKTLPPQSEDFLDSPKPIRKACYDQVLKTIYSPLTPKMILKKGNMELHRAEIQMLQVAQDMGNLLLPPESIAAFIKRVFTEMSLKQEFIIHEEQEYRQKFDEYYQRVLVALPAVTSKIPTIDLIYDFTFIPSEGGPSGSSAGYNLDTMSEPIQGHFMTFIRGDAHFRTFELPVLFFHEAIPGHHFEVSGSHLINKDKTKFDKEKFYSPYIEGWGFYMEEFALEAGLYKTPEEIFGFWDFQRLRSLRMIVSYMYFYENWTEEQGIQFFEEHIFGDKDQATLDASRPKDWQGQGLGYMVGKTVMQGIRDAYTQEVGRCAKSAEVHDFILDQAGTALDTLVSEYAQWISKHRCADKNKTVEAFEKNAQDKILNRF